YAHRRQLLASIASVNPADLLQSWPDGRIKLFLTHRLLRFRREHAVLFHEGNYTPLRVTGTFAESCVAFLRQHEEEWFISVAPRLCARVGFPPIGERWQDTRVEFPLGAGTPLVDLFTRRTTQVEGGSFALSDALSALPFALYTAA
ncbi:MAG: malto-oligosyltrehalose synthase, partial [Verrucomicrobiota bacterium]|nr:malto-oligosyltrehalose synthase [Verrucomicrobiota bacterium]